MKVAKTLLISALVVIAFVLAGCGTAHVQSGEKSGIRHKQVTWRPTGTGFYHAEVDYHRYSSD